MDVTTALIFNDLIDEEDDQKENMGKECDISTYAGGNSAECTQMLCP
jgi:hypothetical protein